MISYHFSFISYHYSVIFYHYSFIFFSFLSYLWVGTLLYLISFLGWNPFISFSFLSARRIFVHNYSYFLYGDAPLVLQVTASTQAPIISHFFFIKSSTIFNGPFAERWNVNRHLKFCLIKVYYYLAGRFDSILFNWAIINFFLIEYYVRAYWISYV